MKKNKNQSDESNNQLGHSIFDGTNDEDLFNDEDTGDYEEDHFERSPVSKKKKHKQKKEKKHRDTDLKPSGSEHERWDESFSSKKKLFITIGILVGLLVLLIVAWNLYYTSMLNPVSDSTEEVIVEIPEGSTIKDVAKILHDKGLIKNAMIFESYAGRHSRGTKKIQAANYKFSPSLSSVEIFNRMLDGDTYSGVVPVTIPEGKNIKEIAQILEDGHICSATDFINETNKISEYKEKYPILSSVPEDKEGRVPMEGYLYPDTYQLASDSDPSTVVNMMLNRFTEKFDTSMQQKAKDQNKSIDDIVTMASIVELETKLDEDKANVASVFYNRIAANMPLQSDITVDYARGTKTAVLSTEETKIESPYNTYIHTGLPVGPICSPGIKSLQAALEPATTNYYYFVADMSTGKIHFNETLDGHNADVEKYMGDQSN